MDRERETAEPSDTSQNRAPEKSAKERDIVFDDWAMI